MAGVYGATWPAEPYLWVFACPRRLSRRLGTTPEIFPDGLTSLGQHRIIAVLTTKTEGGRQAKCLMSSAAENS